jgi:hypothetical protein
MFWKCGKVQIFGNDSNNSKLDSGRNSEETLSVWLYSPLDFCRFFSLLILYTVGRTPWTGDQPVARPLPAHRTTQTQNKRTQTSMTRVRFKLTTPMFERAETAHVLDPTATVMGIKRRLNSGNACYHSVQNLLSSRPLSRNIKIRI